MTTPLDSFETALLARLQDEIAQPDAARSRLSPRVLLGAAAASILGVALALVVPGLGTTTAYSVQEGNAGEVTVEVQRLEDAHGLEAALAEHGVAADVTYLPEREECAPGRYTPVQRPLSGMRVSMGSERLRVTLPPGTVRDGETFVMAVSGETTVADGSFSGWTEFDVTAGPVGACRPRPSSVG